MFPKHEFDKNILKYELYKENNYLSDQARNI